MTADLLLTPRDPLIARDGRPSGASQGRRMRCLDWPYPSVLAGSLRTLLGKSAGVNFKDQETITKLCDISISGPLPHIDNTLYFPAPKDLVIYEDEDNRRIMTLRPMDLKGSEGTDLQAGLSPVNVIKDIKPASSIPNFWSVDNICDWLINTSGDSFGVVPKETDIINGFIYALEKEQRTHVKIESGYGASEEGMLFITSGLDFTLRDNNRQQHLIRLSARVDLPDDSPFTQVIKTLDALHPFGGERRLLHWQTKEQNGLWDCPQRVKDALQDKPQKVRLVLATPALFRDGWKPGWLDINLKGAPPELEGKISLTLKSACVDRWRPLSGWSLEKGKEGPKPIRRMVPAGSVYFFEAEGDTDILPDFWLKSVSDYEQDEQDRRDGFGLALWGVW